jgi:tetratricopeptide (TPR) repeat protein
VLREMERTAPSRRPALLLQSADLLRHLGSPDEAGKAYAQALVLDPDNVHAHLGICRLALRRRDYVAAAKEASECVGRLYFFPMAHFFAAIAQIGLRDFTKARASLETVLSQNPNFPQAHLWLGRLLRFRLNEWYREMRKRRPSELRPIQNEQDLPRAAHAVSAVPSPGAALPPLGDDVLVISGLPRSSTSMLMQMLEAGGMTILTDGVREADEDNPRGYFEFESVKKLGHCEQSGASRANDRRVLGRYSRYSRHGFRRGWFPASEPAFVILPALTACWSSPADSATAASLFTAVTKNNSRPEKTLP